MGNPLLKARACSDACDLNASTLGCHISSDLFKSALCCFLGTLPSLLNIESVRDFTMKAVRFWIVWSTGQLLVPSSLFWVKKIFFSGNFVLNIIGHTFLSLIVLFFFLLVKWYFNILGGHRVRGHFVNKILYFIQIFLNYFKQDLCCFLWYCIFSKCYLSDRIKTEDDGDNILQAL